MVDRFQEEYEKLRTLADGYMRRFSSSPTLQATALVHEAYLKMAKESRGYTDQSHFLCTAATAMRQILVDHARSRGRIKRGGEFWRVTLGGIDGLQAAMSAGIDVLILNEAIERLEEMDERQARIVELRFFVGLSVEEVASAMKISEKTVKRDWAMARAWLQRELAPSGKS
jgi:RNA polymerase sigma factor (TIGR02999 family)